MKTHKSVNVKAGRVSEVENERMSERVCANVKRVISVQNVEQTIL